jgi:serpin B
LEARNREGNRDENPQLLRVSNDFWMAPDLMPEGAFLDTLARYYGAGVHLAPFANEPEACRREINAKVSDDTGQLIPELLPRDSIDDRVVFVLTNALYFKSHWQTEFDPKLTRPGPFTTLGGATVEADIMHQRTQAGYLAGDGFFALSLPYDGNALSMVFLVPELGGFDDFAQSLDSAKIDEIVLGLAPTEVELSLPKFEVSGEIPLADELEAAGMVDAFDAARADFTALAPNVYISDAFHQAKLILNEEGTEAGAATAFVGRTTSIPPEPTTVEIDRPFLFLLRDATGAPLFVGQFAAPR